jgi:hypothetical protein
MRLVSAKIETVKMTKAMNAGIQNSAVWRSGRPSSPPFQKREQQPAVVRLELDDFPEVEFAEVEQHRDDREAERDLVGYHLRGRAHAADEGELRVRGPAGQGDAVNGERGDREDKQRADIEVRDDEFLGAAEERDRRAEGNHAHGDERGATVSAGASQ